MYKSQINKTAENLRIDKFLCQEFDISFATAQKLIRQKKVKVNGQKAQIDQKLQADDEVEIFSAISKRKDKQLKKPNLSPEKISSLKNHFIFEDENLIILNKPSGLATQGGSKIEISVDDFLSHFKTTPTQETPKLVHRLDKDTSGILLIAKNKKTSEYFFEKFKNRDVKKTYLALVKGVVKKDEGVINIPIAKKMVGKNEKVYKDEIDGKQAITHYKTLDRFEDFSLLELKPLTGRTHQLRVHCKEIGYPIVNDFKYGGKAVLSDNLGSRLCLHAFKIEIDDYFDKKLSIKTNLPDFLKGLRISANAKKDLQ